MKRMIGVAVLVCLCCWLESAQAADLIVSANDGKYVRVDGRGTYPPNPAPDTLTVIDVSKFPPAVVATIEVQHTIHGPPQSVAITPDGTMAFVSAPDRYDYRAGQQTKLPFIQVVDLEAQPPRVMARVDIGAHPQGLSVSPNGKLLLAAAADGTVAVLTIDGKRVALQDRVKAGRGKLAGVMFTHDGRTAIVANRDDQGLSVLAIEGGNVSLTNERISSGVTPYAVDVSSDGKWAVVSNVGLAAIEGRMGSVYGDTDTITLIDTSRRPFRAVQHVTVPSVPEGVAISPDGRYIVVVCMNGSHLPEGTPGHNPRGALVLFENQQGKVRKLSEVQTGTASQGVVFTQDGRYVLVQMNVDKAIGIYEVADRRLSDTGHRIKLSGGPTSMRSMPR